MTQKEKLIETFLKNPTSLKFSQILIVLDHYGFREIQAKGSHVKFKHPSLTHDLIIPVHNKDCMDFYKKQARKCVDELSA